MFAPALKTCDLQANEKQMESMKKEEEAKKADSIVRWEETQLNVNFHERKHSAPNENNSRCSKKRTR